jgi:rhamnulokinase
VNADPLYLAIDLGAGSGRVFLAGVAPGELRLEPIRRFHYPPRRHDRHLRWDFASIIVEIQQGLRAGAARADALGRPVASIGVDGWGTDYGLVSSTGQLIEDPVCYRDERTIGVMEEVFARLPRDEIFTRTGIQFLQFNTLYQLAAHARAGFPSRAARLLLVPDLVTAALTGRAVTEFTNATTTQMVNVATGRWDDVIVAALGLPAGLLCDIVAAGQFKAPLTPESAAATGLAGVPVAAVATHDTGSAVAGAPLEAGWAYISSGTWSLVGVELERPFVNADVARHNFTNEGGAFGTTRFLKNVMGLWILESCRAEWLARGIDVDHGRLIEGVAALKNCAGVVFPDDPRLLNPSSMLAALAAQMRETGQAPPESPVAMAKVVLDSLALRYASVLRRIERLTGRPISGVRIVGGGSQNGYLNQAAATATGLPVTAGPVEATAIGNALVQAVADGRFGSLADARRHVSGLIPSRTYAPRPTPAWKEAVRRYEATEAHLDR